jgi:ABC-type bacteriocin/lantibiotic exporter with double-glycine peptidase domain
LGEITDYSGKVTVNGIEQSQLNFDSWYEKLGLVLQDIKLFNSSILDNLTLDSNAIPKSNIVAICKMIEIDKDIQHMPHKYDSIISSLGRSLSGGQRQRIAIAQALLRKPEILIMDEPTSDLDYHSAKAIWNLFNFYNDPITLITITHDLNKLDIFDRVIILKEGKITQILTKSEVKHIGKDIAKLL